MRASYGRPAVLVGTGAVLAVIAFQLWITPSNPPGYHRDEAANSYNAYTLSQDLRDEDGALLPLFFRSFGDYKSPLYPYLLAAVFKITGPDAQVARGVSAVLVLSAVLLLGLLARRVTGSNLVAVVVVVLAGATPWLFELGRVALEASTQPLLIVLLLLWLERVWRDHRWTVAAGAATGALLGVLVYSYTGSRLLGPLLAGALVVFAGRGRWTWLATAWGTFAAFLVPLGVYALRHPGALTSRYEQTTIAREGKSRLEVVAEGIGNWFKDGNPWHWATKGDPAPYIHNGGYAALYAAVVLLAIAGAVGVLARQRANLWWRYVLVATLVAPIPAALTVDRYNALRLAAFPVFVLTLAIPAVAALLQSARTLTWARLAIGVLAATVVFQFAQFLDEYRTRGPGRIVLYEAGVVPLLQPIFDEGDTIYVDYDDRGAQVKARWHAVERGVPSNRIVVLPEGGVPPPGSVVFGLFEQCAYVCDEFARWEKYWLARAVGP